MKEMHPPALPDPLAIFAEVWRCAGRCHPRWETTGLLTLPRACAEGEYWRPWRDAVFRPMLVPAMERARIAAAAGDLPEIAACDRRLDAVLPPDAAARSRMAGALLLENFRWPAGERTLRRYAMEAAGRRAPGHLPVVAAVRGAAFCLPPAMAVAGYLLMEARGAGASPAALWKILEDCLDGWGEGTVQAAA